MGLRVLVVDDDRGHADSLAAVLAAGGRCDARAAYGGAEAVALAAAFAPQLAFVDLLLPDADGLAVAAALRALPRPPRLLVCLSGAAADGLADLARAAGFQLVLAKPVSPARLLLVLVSAAAFAD
jgi:CheY-like chemotaxis protein